MKQIKIVIPLVILIFTLSACQSTSSNSGVSPTVTNNPTHLTSSNFKLNPYKSAILKYKHGGVVYIWDNWGAKTYASRGRPMKVFIVNNGTEYWIDHYSKSIQKGRSDA